MDAQNVFACGRTCASYASDLELSFLLLVLVVVVLLVLSPYPTTTGDKHTGQR